MFNFTKQEKVVVAFLAAAFMSGAAVLSFRHVPHTVNGAQSPACPQNAAAQAGTVSRSVRVHIAGAVLYPGTYDIARGATVLDAVDRAVPTPEADMVTLTGGAPVQDGMRILVPARAGEAGVSQDAKLNINTASADELDALPGIGPRLAEKIVAYRSDAPFQDVADLKKVDGIGEKKFEAIKDRVRTK